LGFSVGSKMTRFAVTVLLGWLCASAAPLPACNVSLPAGDVCDDFCSYRCSFYNTSAGDTGKHENVTLYRLTPLNVTGLRNKNTGDAYGDINYWISKKNMSRICAQDPRAHGCIDASEDLYGIFTLEIDGQYGPYLQCNPVQGGGPDPVHNPLWMDTSNFSCGQNCIIATTEGCWNHGLPPVVNATSMWGDYHCSCDGSRRDNLTVGRAAPPFLGKGPPGWVPQCRGYDPPEKGRCFTGRLLRSLTAWSTAAMMTLACEECRKDEACSGWSLAADNTSVLLLTGNLTQEDANCSASAATTDFTRRASWFGIGDLGGLWYSTPTEGECRAGALLGDEGCTWREVFSAYKNASCVGQKVDEVVERFGATCFGRCAQPLNHTSDCYLSCYRDLLDGNAAKNITKIPPKMVVDAWVHALERPPVEGGCPTVVPEPCRGRQCDPLLAWEAENLEIVV